MRAPTSNTAHHSPPRSSRHPVQTETKSIYDRGFETTGLAHPSQNKARMPTSFPDPVPAGEGREDTADTRPPVVVSRTGSLSVYFLKNARKMPVPATATLVPLRTAPCYPALEECRRAGRRAAEMVARFQRYVRRASPSSLAGLTDGPHLRVDIQQQERRHQQQGVRHVLVGR